MSDFQIRPIEAMSHEELVAEVKRLREIEAEGARDTAAEATQFYPNNAPYTAVQMAPVGEGEAFGTPMTDYAELRAALEAGPTPGPWRGRTDGLDCGLTTDCAVYTWERCIAQIPDNPLNQRDVAYIAAANPETIRALLAERDALREALLLARSFVAEALTQARDAYRGHDWESNIARVERYLAQIDAALAHGPRACTCHPDDRPDGPCRERYAASECQALAAPAVQGEPGKVPEGYVLIAEDYLEVMIGPERMDHLRRSCRFPVHKRTPDTQPAEIDEAVDHARRAEGDR